MTVAGGEHDGRSASTPATSSIVPTRDELQARWTCNCERLGLVVARVAGSHTAAAVLCPDRVKAGEGAGWRVGDVTEVLVPAVPASPGDFPKNVHTLWMAARRLDPDAFVTWALCLRARSRPNPAWAQAAEDQAKEEKRRQTPKTILVPQPWESWAIRGGVVRGTWAGWSGEAPTPEVFRVLGVRGSVSVTEAMKIIKSM